MFIEMIVKFKKVVHRTKLDLSTINRIYQVIPYEALNLFRRSKSVQFIRTLCGTDTVGIKHLHNTQFLVIVMFSLQSGEGQLYVTEKLE